jgi:inner membrane protein involved in colicin E2 resistance
MNSPTRIPVPAPTRIDRRNAVTLKLVFITVLVVVLLLPLQLVNGLRAERRANLERGLPAYASTEGTSRVASRTSPADPGRAPAAEAVERRPVAAAGMFDAYRMVERAVKHGALVLALVLAAFFLFEILAGLRLHAVHYGLVGAALVLFYLALLALGEVIDPNGAYLVAALASSGMVVGYSASILRSWARAAVIAGLLAAVHGTLFVVLRMENLALLAGTGALFVALGTVMFFTRRIDWHAEDGAPAASGAAEGATAGGAA